MIPNEVNICGVPHRIIPVMDCFTDKGHFGEITYTAAEIRINMEMPDALQMQTLVHEWLHGALVMLGFNEESENEKLVAGLSVAINQTFVLREEQT